MGALVLETIFFSICMRLKCNLGQVMIDPWGLSAVFADYAPLSDIFTEIQMTHTCTGRLCNLSSKSCICAAVCLHFTFSLALVVCVRNRFLWNLWCHPDKPTTASTQHSWQLLLLWQQMWLYHFFGRQLCQLKTLRFNHIVFPDSLRADKTLGKSYRRSWRQGIRQLV